MYQEKFMKLAIAEAKAGIRHHHGGPFGAVIVKNGKKIASGHNRVLKNNDSTCHGEIDAIRKAERKLKTYDLSGCQIYTTGEPCPMCLSAILWSNIDKVYYGCTLADNTKLGFRDNKINKLLEKNAKLHKDFLEQKDREKCLQLFDKYAKSQKTIY